MTSIDKLPSASPAAGVREPIAASRRLIKILVVVTGHYSSQEAINRLIENNIRACGSFGLELVIRELTEVHPSLLNDTDILRVAVLGDEGGATQAVLPGFPRHFFVDGKRFFDALQQNAPASRARKDVVQWLLCL